MIRGASTVTNQTIDAQTLANANMITVPIDSDAESVLENGIEPGTPIPVASLEEKEMIGTLTIGNPDIVASLTLLEAFRAFIERLGHVADPQLGRIEAGKRTPAATVLSLIQEGTRLIDEVISRMRPVAGQLVLQLIELQWQRDPGFFSRVLSKETGDLISQAFETRANLNDHIKITLSAASAQRSKQIDQQNLMSFSQFILGYAQQLIELAVPFTNPQVPPEWRVIAIPIVKALEKTMLKLADVFDQEEPTKQIPLIAALLEEVSQSIGQQQQQIAQQQQQQQQQGQQVVQQALGGGGQAQGGT